MLDNQQKVVNLRVGKRIVSIGKSAVYYKDKEKNGEHKMEDRRVRKTKQQLQQALAVLLSEKSIQQITVKELCDIVDINRTTFYAHYQDVYDLMEQLEKKVGDAFLDIVNQHPLELETIDLMPMEVEIFRYLAEEKDIAKALFCHRGSLAMIQTIYHIIMDYFELHWRKLLPEQQSDQWKYSFHFVVGGCVGLMQHWLETGMKETPEEMAEVMSIMVSHGVFGYGESVHTLKG